LPIKNIKAVINIETESNELAEIIQTAIDPDNLTAPPMTFHSVYTSNKLEYVINNLVSIETLLATLMDLLSVFQVTEKALNAISEETR
jgi:hypothetical protein